MTASGDYPEGEREALRQRYARLPDYDIAHMYATGPAGLVSAEAWECLEHEYLRRGLEGSDAKQRVQADVEAERLRDAVSAAAAPFATRLLQGVADTAMAAAAGAAAGLLVAAAVAVARGGDDLAFGLGGLAFLFVLLGYQPFFEFRFHGTPLMRALGLQVVTAAGERPRPRQLLVRLLLRPLVLLGPIWYVLGQTPWGHDVLSGTRVIMRQASDPSSDGSPPPVRDA